MKNALFLVILLVGGNCIAQNIQFKSQIRHSSFSAIGKGMMQNSNQSLKSSRSNFVMKGELPASYSIPKQNMPVQLIDSVYMWSWDTINTDWALDYKYCVTEYDTDNNILTELGKNWNGNDWVNSDITFYTYDERNNNLSYEWQYWTGTGWENYQKGSYEYDANNNILNELVQDWDGSNWINSIRIKNTFDANSNKLLYIHQGWDGTKWENFWQHIYTYDANKNITSEIRQGWTGDQWENSWQNTYEYDINNNLIHEINQVDNGAELVTSEIKNFYNTDNKLVSDSTHTSGNSWEYDRLGTYIYDSNGNLLSWLSQSINVEIPENLTRTLFTYDVANNNTSTFRQDWKDNSWVNLGLDRYSYNEYNLLTNDAYMYWNSNGTMVMDGDSSAYYYHSVNTRINENGQSKGNIKVFPNPSGGIFTFESNNTINSFEIYNSFGKLIYSESGFNPQTKNEINISNYGKGFYLLKIQTSTGFVSKKVLIK